MKDVLDRLRASKAHVGSEQFQSGHESGREWAENEAEADELTHLARVRDEARGDLRVLFTTYDNDAYGAFERFVFTIWTEHDADRSMAREFWERQVGNEHPRGSIRPGIRGRRSRSVGQGPASALSKTTSVAHDNGRGVAAGRYIIEAERFLGSLDEPLGSSGRR
jgi:hypothetical protein